MLKLRAYRCRCSARCRVRLALLPLRLSAASYPGFLRKPGRCSPCSPYLTVSPGSTSALCCLRTAVAGPFPFSARASSRRCPSFNCCDRAAPRSQAQPSPLPPALPRCGRAHNRPSLEYRPRSRAGSRQQGCPHQLPCRTLAGAPGLLRCSARASGPACAALPLGQRRRFFLPPAAERARGLGTVGHRWPCRRCLRTWPVPPLPRGRFSAVVVQPRPGLTAGRCSLCSVRSLLGKKQGEDGIYPSKRIIRVRFAKYMTLVNSANVLRFISRKYEGLGAILAPPPLLRPWLGGPACSSRRAWAVGLPAADCCALGCCFPAWTASPAAGPSVPVPAPGLP